MQSVKHETYSVISEIGKKFLTRGLGKKFFYGICIEAVKEAVDRNRLEDCYPLLNPAASTVRRTCMHS